MIFKKKMILMLVFIFSLTLVAAGCGGTPPQIDQETGTLTEHFDTEGETEIVIPSQIDGVTVKAIGEQAFFDKNLTKVTLPDSVEIIEREAFRNNNLVEVNLSSNLKTIGNSAFRNNLLTEITIPDSVESIAGWTFFNNNLSKVTLGDNIDISSGWDSSFPRDLGDVYIANDKLGGTYVEVEAGSWEKQE